MLMPMVMLAQKRAAKMLVKFVAVSVMFNFPFNLFYHFRGDSCYIA